MVERLEEELRLIDTNLNHYHPYLQALSVSNKAGYHEPVTRPIPVPAALPSFKGSSNIKSFIDRYEAILRTEDFPPHRWVPVLERCFEGPDLYFVKTEVIAGTTDWATAKQLLITTFGPRNPKKVALKELTSFKQGLNEAMTACCNRFRELVASAGAHDNNLIATLFLEGINGYSRSKLEQMPFIQDAEPDLPPVAKILDKALSVCELKKTSSSTMRQYPSYKSAAPPSAPKLAKSPPAPPLAPARQFFTSPPRPHLPSNHDLKAVSVVTEESIKSDFEYPAPAIPSPTSSIPVLVVRDASENEPFLAPISIEGFKMHALIDTGAAVSIIADHMAEMLDIKSTPSGGHLQMAQKDNKVPRRLTVDKLKVLCGSHSLSWQFDVMNMPDETPCILGRDILRSLGIGLMNLPFCFPGEQGVTLEPNEILDEAATFAKVKLDDQEPGFQGLIDDLMNINLMLEPSTPCTYPKGGYKLKLKANSKPVFRRQYPLTSAKQDAIDETVGKWIKLGIVKQCSEGSPFNSPLITVPKRDLQGTKTGVRVCIDPRPINDLLEDDSFIVPLVNEVFEKTASARYFSTIDLREAYTQIALSDESQPLTAFTWKGLQYVFTRCIFGIKTMSAMFQRVITNVLKECLEFAISYVDDIVVFSNSLEEHVEHVSKVLQALTAANLRINNSKSKFGHRVIKLLGFLIDEFGISPDPAQLKHVFDFPRPSSTKELQRFMGVCNFLRQHILNYTELARPLEKCRLSSKFDWLPEHELAFVNLKSAIVNANILSTPRSDLPLFLATDASNSGVASMLYQVEGDKTFFLSFDSRSLRPAEINYHAHKKELLAIVFGLLKNSHILANRPFTLLTDHQSLTFLFTQKHANIMMENWMDIISSYNFIPCHLPGVLNVIPDALSRAPVTPHSCTSVFSLTDTPPMDLWSIHELGHFQEDKMVEWLKDRDFTWPNMRQHCADIAKACTICQRFNHAPVKYNPLKTIDAARPFDHIQIDLVTDLPLSHSALSIVLVVTDVASKFTLLRPLTNKTAKCVAAALLQIFMDFGPPSILQSDQGREFINALMKEICSTMAIDHRISSAYSPRTNGLVERTNGIWLQILRKLAFFAPKDWPMFIPMTQFVLNTRIATPLQISPFEAMFLRKSNLLIKHSRQPIATPPTADELTNDILFAHNHFWPSLQNTSAASHDSMAESFNANNQLTNYKVDNLVYVRTQSTSKLDPPFDGPYKIVAKSPAGTFTLHDIHGTPYHRLVTTSQLKPATGPAMAPETSDIFEVESILKHRGIPGNYEYLVKWKDYPRAEATWTHERDFTDPLFLKKYWHQSERG